MNDSCTMHSPANMLIATLDLLGVTQMISNAKGADDLMVVYNNIIDLYKIIRDKGTQIIQGTVGRMASHGIKQDVAKSFCDSILEAVQTNFFSDTIVVGLNIDALSTGDAKFPTSKQKIAIAFFFGYIKLIANILMSKGFPIRGAIDSGVVLCGKDLVVGKPYVNTLYVSEKLEFSGVVISENALGLYNAGNEKLKCFCPVLKLQIPTKGGYGEAVCMNWLKQTEKSPSDIMGYNIGDIEQLLYEKFSANGKVVGESAILKLKNTAMTIRAFLAQNKML